MQLRNVLSAWNTDAFDTVFKQEIRSIAPDSLPLQGELKQGNSVSDSDIDVMVIQKSESNNAIHIKAGIFFTGLVMGSCCADHPSGAASFTEYCQLLFSIDKNNGDTRIQVSVDS